MVLTLISSASDYPDKTDTTQSGWMTMTPMMMDLLIRESSLRPGLCCYEMHALAKQDERN
jgi:hypothetical protein